MSLHGTNVLVGPNNCGKSTIISALRLLDPFLRRAQSRKPHPVTQPGGGTGLGYTVSETALPISLENVSTDYISSDSSIEFHFTNRNVLTLFFPRTGGCVLNCDAHGRNWHRPGLFRKEFPIDLVVVPVLSPLEPKEVLVQEGTVQRSIHTHRSSRQFRSYWYYQDVSSFRRFADTVADTWPGMELEKPEITSHKPLEVSLFCRERRITREIGWAGSGFQIWCQLISHLTRANDASLVVVDEPEIYLHADLQRQLMHLLQSTSAQIVLATHSSEIMADADASEILMVDKTKRTAARLKDIDGVQAALEAMGSVHNLTLTQLARSRRVVFVEDLADFRTLRRFARRLEFRELSEGSGLTPIPSGGFSSWERVSNFAKMVEATMGSSFLLAAIYDRDYWCAEQIDEIEEQLRSSLDFAHIHHRKELENYLLDPAVLKRAAEALLPEGKTVDMLGYLERITSALEEKTKAQYLTKYSQYMRSKHTSKDDSTLYLEAVERFAARWKELEGRLELVSGKDVLKQLRTRLMKNHSINLTDARIIASFRRHEIPDDLKNLLSSLDAFRTSESRRDK